MPLKYGRESQMYPCSRNQIASPSGYRVRGKTFCESISCDRRPPEAFPDRGDIAHDRWTIILLNADLSLYLSRLTEYCTKLPSVRIVPTKPSDL